MPTILTPLGEGFDPFSLPAVSILLTALILLSAIHPLGLLVARLADAICACLPARGSASDFRGVDGSPSTALGAGLLYQGAALAPGYILFAAALWTAYDGASISLFDWLSARGNHGPDLRLTVAALLVVSAASGAADSMRAFWSTRSGIRLASTMSLGATALLAVAFYQSGFSLTWIPGVLFAGFLVRAGAKLGTHGVMLFGFAGLIWSALMLLPLVLANISAALLGPFLAVARRIIERPGCAGDAVGNARALALATGRTKVPACHTIDALPAMISPR